MRTRNLKAALLTVTTLVVAGCSHNDRPVPPPPMQNAAPTIAMIANITANQDTPVGPVEFAVSDDTTPANQLTVTAALDGATPIPTDGVMLAGTGGTRSITLTPLEAATGTSMVTVRVIDAQGLITTRSFTVTVNARGASVRDNVFATFAKGD